MSLGQARSTELAELAVEFAHPTLDRNQELIVAEVRLRLQDPRLTLLGVVP